MHASPAMGEIENEPARPKVTDAKGILKQNREFLDFFWDIAKPEQEIRLKAVENLIEYLKNSDKPDELKYTLKRLVDGLAHTREVVRPGFSLALGQLLSVFEEIPLHTALDQIKDKHNLKTVKKKLFRNAAFGNFFGVLALSQSSRLHKEPQVVLQCVQLLQSLSQHKEHLRDLPTKTMVDILSETPEAVFEEVLLGALQSDLSSAFSTPEQLQLLLVAMQRFPQALKPKKLKKLLGSATIITTDNIPKLVEVMKTAARSVKKERLLPAVALDLLQVSLREDSFTLFWDQTIVNGVLKDQAGPSQYLSFRLLGAALPLLSLTQLKQVLSGDVMRNYGEHVVGAQLKDRFKFAPEMETYVGDFLRDCADDEKQMAVMTGFTLLTNQGYPVVPSGWRVVQHLTPAVLRRYADWLMALFLCPQTDVCLDFSTRRQKENQDGGAQKESCVFRLRRWIIPRLTSLVDQQVRLDEDLVMDIARFVFFHAFFDTKKETPDIPETEGSLTVPLDDKTRQILVNSFFGVLQNMNHLPVLGASPEAQALNQKHVQGVAADGSMWIYRVVQYAHALLSQPDHAQSTQPFTPEQRQAWDSMQASVATLMKKAKKGQTPETNAFQQLFLLVGIHLFKAPDDLVDLMKDLKNCMDKAHERKSKRKKTAAAEGQEEEPHWAEVVVDILLSLLSRPSRHIRQVCKTVFAGICPHLTARALNAILDVLDPDRDEEDSTVVVTDDKVADKTKKRGKGDEDEEMEEESDASDDEENDDDNDDDDEEEEDEDEDEGLEEDEDMEETPEVDQNFRIELMKVLQNQNALATEEDGSDEDELDDEAMLKLDDSIAALFAEQKKRNLAKKDEKDKLRKEKCLVRDFRIKVLDLVEVFLAKQGSSPLVLGMVEPLLDIIQSCIQSSDSDQQEQDFLRKAADIFKNQLCRAKQYCKTLGDRQGELHALLERLVTKAQRLSDSSVSLYFFSASLYLVKVLRGKVPDAADKKAPDVEELRYMGDVDVEKVTAIFKEALCSFMSRRKSPLSGQMFTDLFNRFPVLCVNLLDTAVEHISAGVREHQQAQACILVLRAMQSREVQLLLAGAPWTELCSKVVVQLTKSLELEVLEVQSKTKAVQDKVVKSLDVCVFLVKNINQQKLAVDLEPLQAVLRPVTEVPSFRKSGQLEDTYWAVMKHFGVTKPKFDKQKKTAEEQGQQNVLKKKKGFLPETKKRKNRKKQLPVSETGATDAKPASETAEGGQGKKKNKKKYKKRKGGGGEATAPSPAKKRKQGGGEGEATAPSPAKKAKTQPLQSPAKKAKTQPLQSPAKKAKKAKSQPPVNTAPKKKKKAQKADGAAE